MNHIIIVCLSCFLSFYHASIIASDDELNEHTKLVNGEPIIFLDKDVQQISGLKTLILKKIEFQPELITYGKAIDIDPILKIRIQFLANSAQSKGTKVRLLDAKKNISRLKNLHENEVISTRKLQQQNTQWQSEQAVHAAHNYQNQLIINHSRLKWGTTISHWITSQYSSPLNQFISGKLSLLKITLPIDSSLPTSIDKIYIEPAGNRNSAVPATFISQLPQVDELSQGYQYLFQTDSPKIRTGMTFTAWISDQKNIQTGIIIPESSIAWHLGQPLVFIKMGEEHFLRRNLINLIKTPGGYFIADQIKDSKEIVVTGTQMLLSHELKAQIPDEDDDD